MFKDLLSRESRFPPLIGAGLAAILMGGVAVASAQASLPAPKGRPVPPAPAVVAAADPAAPKHDGAPAYSFASPLSGFAVNSPFGLRKLPWEEGGRLHQGVDIAAPSGTAVRVTLPGTVVRSGIDGGYGRFVEVSHGNGLTSFYAHMGRFAQGLKPGAPVGAGQVLGYVGSSGRSTGAHLHFEIRLNGAPLNPVAFMGRTFATAKDLPLRAAARIPRRVRIAQVAEWPRGVANPARKIEAATVTVAPAKGGRVRATISPIGVKPPVATPAPAPAAETAPEKPVVVAAAATAPAAAVDAAYRAGDLPIGRSR